ncbi:MAG: motility protein A [Kiritimatiellae bacterium]|nr:motility protein A [Kiritimatiellia bacterium]MDD4734797.1 motility protein A [Kiritimatiellia bacterium]
MDIGTLIGIILGWALIVASIVMGGGAGFINVPAVLITIGGALSATLIHYPLPKVLGTIAVVRKAFSSKEQDYIDLFKKMSDLAVRARRDGLLALEDDIDHMEDPFMRKGFQMAVDGNTIEVIRSVLEGDVDSMVQRHQVGQGVFKSLGSYAPAFGMIGTLIGLVQMLRNMTDPSAIGSGMAVALITTLYGAMVANLLALPLAGKLEQRSNEEIALKSMVVEGVISIQEGNSPRIVEEKLRSFIPPKLREKTGDGA